MRAWSMQEAASLLERNWTNVIAAEKKLSNILIDETSIHKIDKVSDYMGVTYSGIGPDFNSVLMKARKDVQ